MRVNYGHGLVKVVRDSKSLTEARYHQIEECDPVTEETRDAVRRLICANAQGETDAEQRADAEELMAALGIHPSQDDDSTYATAPPELPNNTRRDTGFTPGRRLQPST